MAERSPLKAGRPSPAATLTAGFHNGVATFAVQLVSDVDEVSAADGAGTRAARARGGLDRRATEVADGRDVRSGSRGEVRHGASGGGVLIRGFQRPAKQQSHDGVSCVDGQLHKRGVVCVATISRVPGVSPPPTACPRLRKRDTAPPATSTKQELVCGVRCSPLRSAYNPHGLSRSRSMRKRIRSSSVGQPMISLLPGLAGSPIRLTGIPPMRSRP